MRDWGEDDRRVAEVAEHRADVFFESLVGVIEGEQNAAAEPLTPAAAGVIIDSERAVAGCRQTPDLGCKRVRLDDQRLLQEAATRERPDPVIHEHEPAFHQAALWGLAGRHPESTTRAASAWSGLTGSACCAHQRAGPRSVNGSSSSGEA